MRGTNVFVGVDGVDGVDGDNGLLDGWGGRDRRERRSRVVMGLMGLMGYRMGGERETAENGGLVWYYSIDVNYYCL